MHLIFDLDGTLIDSLPGIAAALNHALESESLPTHSLEAIRSFIGTGSLELVRQALPTGSSNTLAHQLDSAFKHHYAGHWQAGSMLYPGIRELVGKLHHQGHHLAVLSNKPDAFTREIVDHFFPGGVFASVMGHSDRFPRKPAPDSALHLLHQWHAAPESARFIGDSDIDYTTARNAGIPFIGVDWGYHPTSNMGGTIASNTDELAALIDQAS